MKILDTLWFTQMDTPSTIGIVKTLNEVGEVKYYIGTGHGLSSSADSAKIASFGARVDPEIFWNEFVKGHY